MRLQGYQWSVVSVVLSAMLFALCFSVEAQQSKKVSRIGYLTSNSLSADSSRVDAFRQELRELGYTEGQNIAIEYRYAGGAKFDRLPNFVGELVGLKVDVLVTATTAAALAAKNATRTVPIVFLGVTDPIAAGLIDSLARPGGNLTGVTNIAAVLVGKRLELLKETVSKLSRVAVLWDPQNQASVEEWNESQLPARALGLQLHSVKVSIADQYESAFREAAMAQCAALAVTQHVLAVNNIGQIVDLAVKNRSRRCILGHSLWTPEALCPMVPASKSRREPPLNTSTRS